MFDLTVGSDYLALNQMLIFNSGDQMMCVEIEIINDLIVEVTETFQVGLETVSGEMIGVSRAVVTILDDDFEGLSNRASLHL